MKPICVIGKYIAWYLVNICKSINEIPQSRLKDILYCAENISTFFESLKHNKFLLFFQVVKMGNTDTHLNFLKIFFMWTIFKVFIEFVTILLPFYVLVFWPRGMWES